MGNAKNLFPLVVGLIVVGSFKTLVEGNYTTRQWLDFVVFGIAQGSIYALIALGYTLVYGILRMINFAHSDVYMFGAFMGYYLANNDWIKTTFGTNAASAVPGCGV